MPIDERTILAELAEIRKAQREDHAQLVSQIGELSKDVSTMRAEGCGQAWQHKEHAEAIATLRGQVADLKESRAEGKGRGAVLTILVSAFTAVVVGVLVAVAKAWFGA